MTTTDPRTFASVSVTGHLIGLEFWLPAGEESHTHSYWNCKRIFIIIMLWDLLNEGLPGSWLSISEIYVLKQQTRRIERKELTVDILSENTDNATHWLKQEFRVTSWRIVRITHRCVEEWHRCMEDTQNPIMMQISWREIWKDVSTNTSE